MSEIQSNEIIIKVNNLLNDPSFIRWTKQELLDYLNDGQRAVVIRRPDAFVEDEDEFVCVAGTKQKLPANALRLIDVPRNFNGRAIRGPYDKNNLTNYPNWYSGANADEAELYVYDERNPHVFYLYQGVKAGVKVNVVYSKAPPVISIASNDTGALIALDDIYANAIAEWMMYRCYMKDAEYASDPNKSAAHLSAFRAQLGDKSQADGAMAGQVIKE